MKIVKATLAVALAVAVGGCSSISTTYDFDTRVDFAEFHTFDWMPEQPVTIPDPRREQTVRDLFIAALEARATHIVTEHWCSMWSMPRRMSWRGAGRRKAFWTRA